VRYRVDAAVAYHGGDTEKYLGEIDGLHAPMLMHLAEEDEFISKAAQAEIKTALAKKPKRDSLQLSGSASRLRSAQRGALQCRGGSARQRADKRISASTTPVSFGPSSLFARLERLRLRSGRRFCRAEKRSRERLQQIRSDAVYAVGSRHDSAQRNRSRDSEDDSVDCRQTGSNPDGQRAISTGKSACGT
jgi:hypothetical protein